MRDGRLDCKGTDGFVAERVCYYAALYPELREVARQHGYALALHGSLVRDLDLVAIPWTDEAGEPDALVRAIVERCGALVPGDNPTPKPHGREAWTILFGDGGGYIDLSVMPRIFAPAP